MAAQAKTSEVVNAAALMLAALVGDKGTGVLSQATREHVVREAISLYDEVERQIAASHG